MKQKHTKYAQMNTNKSINVARSLDDTTTQHIATTWPQKPCPSSDFMKLLYTLLARETTCARAWL